MFFRNPLISSLTLNILFFGIYGFPLYTSKFYSSHFARPDALGTSDLTGATRVVEIFGNMDWTNGWTTYVSSPTGESIYNVFLLSQAIPHLLLFVLNPLGPMLAVFLTQLLFTFLSVYFLFLFLDCFIKKSSTKILFVVAIFISNFVRDSLQAHLIGNLWGVPLLLIVLLRLQLTVAKRLVYLFVYFLTIILTDIYLVYISFFILISNLIYRWIFENRKTRISGSENKKIVTTKLHINHKRLGFIVLIFILVPMIINSELMERVWDKIYNQGILTEAKSLGFYPFSRGYLQILLLILLIVLLISRKRISEVEAFLLVTVTILFLYSVNLAGTTLNSLTPTQSFRKLLPNFDHNQRLVPILVILSLTILIVRFESRSDLYFKNISVYWGRFFVGTALFITVVRTFTLVDQQHVAVHPERYAVFRETIRVDESYLAYPLELEGRTWIQQSYIGRATANSLTRSNHEISDAFLAGPTGVVNLFVTRKIAFLMMPCSEAFRLRSSWNKNTEGFSKLFTLKRSIIDEGYENGPISICLYAFNSKL